MRTDSDEKIEKSKNKLNEIAEAVNEQRKKTQNNKSGKRQGVFWACTGRNT